MKNNILDIFNQGMNFHQNGHLDKAMVIYKEVLRIDPNHFDSLHLLGVAYSQIDKNEIAIEFIQKAIEINQSNPMIYANLANVQFKIKEYKSALIQCNKALLIDSEYIDALSIKGNILIKLNKTNEALLEFDMLISIDDKHSKTYYDKGNLFLNLGQIENAILNFKQAITLQPDYASAHYNLGNVYFQIDQIDDAIICYKNTIFNESEHIGAYQNLGASYELLNKLNQALECFNRILLIDKTNKKAFNNIINIQMKQCDWTLIDKYFKDFKNLNVLSNDNIPVNMLALFDNPEMHKYVSEEIFASRHEAERFLERKTEISNPKIKIGYFSADFFENLPVPYLMSELFKIHDRTKFEVYGISLGKHDPQDKMQQYLVKTFDKFIHLGTKSDEEVVKLSRDLNIDIAIDLNGYTKGSRPDIFSYKVAPIQVNYLGYPSTLGSKAYDYLIADKTVIPNSFQKYYTEKIAYLPDTYFVHPSNQSMKKIKTTKKIHDLPENSFIFCCFNQSYKILPSTFNVWMKILFHVVNSVLWLSSSNLTAQNNLRQEAEKRGVKGDRLIFAKYEVNHEDHLAKYKLADLFLDTYPYNAHTTASDALWAGLPILTCSGRSFASRVAASLLNAVKLPELITYSSKDFELKALDIAQNPKVLQNLKLKLDKNKFKEPLFNCKKFKENLEKAFKKMHSHFKSRLKPQTFEV